MALNAGEVEVLLKLRDELSSQLSAVKGKLKDVGTAAGETNKDASTLSGSFLKMTSSFLTANVITQASSALIGMGKEAFNSATHVADLASKTGLSTDTIQKMAFVAESTGSTVEAFTQNAFKLSLTLAGGGDSVVGALDRLGLSFSSIKKMSPDEQFATIMNALGKMTSEGERAQVGIAIFGKGFAEMASAVSQGYDELADKATLMSQETIAAADAFDDKWVESKTFMKALLAETASFVWDARLPFVALGESVGLFAKEVAKAKGDVELSAPVYADWAGRMGEAHKIVDALTKGQLEQIQSAQLLGATTEELNHDFGLTEDALKLLPGKIRELAEADKIAKKAVDEHAEAVKKINQEYAERMDLALHAIKVEDLATEAAARAKEVLDKKNAAFMGWRDQQVAATKAVSDAVAWEKAYNAEQEALTKSTDALSNAQAGLANSVNTTAASLKQAVTEALTWSQAMDAVRKGQGTMSATVQAPMTDAQWRKAAADAGGQVNRDSFGNKYVYVPGQNAAGEKIPGFKDGGPTKEGPAYVHDGEYVVPKDGALVMAGGNGGGKSVVVQNTFHIVDTESNIARRVSETIMRTMMSGAQFVGS